MSTRCRRDENNIHHPICPKPFTLYLKFEGNSKEEEGEEGEFVLGVPVVSEVNMNMFGSDLPPHATRMTTNVTESVTNLTPTTNN